MHADPFSGTSSFLIGSADDYGSFGASRFIAVVFCLALIAGNRCVSWFNWSSDPTQRHARHVRNWIMRLVAGNIRYQGKLWKLPVSVLNAFEVWTGAWRIHIISATRDALPPRVPAAPQRRAASCLPDRDRFAVALLLGPAYPPAVVGHCRLHDTFLDRAVLPFHGSALDLPRHHDRAWHVHHRFGRPQPRSRQPAPEVSAGVCDAQSAFSGRLSSCDSTRPTNHQRI